MASARWTCRKSTDPRQVNDEEALWQDGKLRSIILWPPNQSKIGKVNLSSTTSHQFVQLSKSYLSQYYCIYLPYHSSKAALYISSLNHYSSVDTLGLTSLLVLLIRYIAQVQ